MLKHKRLTSILAATLVAAAMIFSSCVREDVTNADLPKGAIRLLADGFKDPKGSKLGVDDQGANVYFIDGDKIWVNGIEHTVRNSSGTTAYFTPDPRLCNENGEINVNLCAVYPADIVTTTNYSSGRSVDINLPATQEYVLADNGRQNVKAPLCAYISAGDANSSRSIQFKHITAAITVAIDNKLSVPLKVKELTLTNSGFELHKSLTINTNELNVPYASQNSQNNVITIGFTNQECSVPANGKIYIQIPILPIQVTNPENGTKGLFTISLKAENDLYGIPEFEYDYLNEQKTTIDPSTGQYRSLVLNVGDLAYAPVEFSPTSAALRVDGLFSISSTEKVFFSKGNLRYKVPENPTTIEDETYFANTANWAFADNQYDVVEPDGNTQVGTAMLYKGQNVNGDGTFWTGVFPYGANGKYTNPRAFFNTGCGSPSNGNVTGTLRGSENEWGKRVGDGKWMTLTDAEWTYLLNSGRMASKNSSNNNISSVSGSPAWLKAKIGGTSGMVIFPDKYWSFLNSTAPLNGTNQYIEATLDQWAVMEKYGAVFLPVVYCYQKLTTRSSFNVVTVNGLGTKSQYWITGNSPQFLQFDFNSNQITTPYPTQNQPANGNVGYIFRAVRLVRLAQQSSQTK